MKLGEIKKTAEKKYACHKKVAIKNCKKKNLFKKKIFNENKKGRDEGFKKIRPPKHPLWGSGGDGDKFIISVLLDMRKDISGVLARGSLCGLLNLINYKNKMARLVVVLLLLLLSA